jgi:hypothetical protein
VADRWSSAAAPFCIGGDLGILVASQGTHPPGAGSSRLRSHTMNDSVLTRLQRFDEQRPGIPGEHWLALAAGIWLLTRRSRSGLGRLASVAGGVALLVRAASGRDGLLGTLRSADLARRLSMPTKL